MFDDLQDKGKPVKQGDGGGINIGNQPRPVNKQKTSNLPLKNNQPRPEKRPGVEDIFANTGVATGQSEMAISGNAQKEKPAQFQANLDTATPDDSLYNDNYSADSRIKWALILLVFFIIFLVIVTWIRFSRLDSGLTVENNNIQNNNKELNKPDFIDDAGGDRGKDGLEDNNEQENNLNGQEGQDTDQDGLTDAQELQLGTDIDNIDTDNDGLFDRDEVVVYKTDPLNPDTDGDGFIDGTEVGGHYNPLGEGELYNLKEEINKQK